MYITYDICFAFVEEFQPKRFRELAREGLEPVRRAIEEDVTWYNREMTALIASGYSEGTARDKVNDMYFLPEEVC